MTDRTPLVGRDDERARLLDALARCRAGSGGVVLVSGESGVGKSRLIAEVLTGWGGGRLSATAVPGAGPYAVLAQVAQGHAAARPADWLADPAQAVPEAIRAAAGRRPTVVVLEDLHLADFATIGLLPVLAEAFADDAVLLIGAYRSDGLPRGHPIRSMRSELRRARRLLDVALRPLAEDQTGELLAVLLGAIPSARLVRIVQERTEGLPFFVEEVAAELRDGRCLERASAGVDLADGAAVPLPESVTDAVLSRTAQLRCDHGPAVEWAVTLGLQVDLPLLADLAGAAEVDPLLECGLLLEFDPGLAVFRHALVHEALARSIPWSRRRRLHQEVAELLTTRGAPPVAVAEHWIAAHEQDRARPLLLAAAEELCAAHAYRDAAGLARRALAMWPEREDPAGRLTTLERLADCAELGGDIRAAADLWADVARRCAGSGDPVRAGRAHRRAATTAELAGELARTVAERRAAAEAFALAGALEEAAEQRLALGAQLRSAGQLTESLRESVTATVTARQAQRRDLEAHALVLEGAVRAALGEGPRGIELARAGLELALAEKLTGVAAEAQYGLAEALEYAADYAGAVHAYESAFELCRSQGLTEFATVCFVCMSPAARLMGEWDRTLAVCGEVLADEGTTVLARRVAEEESALITVLRGERRRPRGTLRRAAEFGRAQGIFGLEIGATWGLAVAASLDDDEPAVALAVAGLLERCCATEECHYALPALRWTATLLAERGDAAGVATCHRLAAGLATRNGSPKVLSALAHVGGELAVIEGDRERASGQFARSVQLLAGITQPYEEAHTQLRWGQSAAVLGDRDAAVSSLAGAYRTARRLGARPLARRCAVALAGMGEPVHRRLGRLAARTASPAPLTRREQEVLQGLAAGRTNREIAQELFVSTRTVDMHVRNLFSKLGCSSRVGAVRQATRLELIPVGG